MTGKNVSQKLAQWTAECPPIKDPAVITLARDALVDIIGCMVAGSGNSEVHLLKKTFVEWGKGGVNVVVGSRERFHPPWAALINGTAAHALDFDDNFIPAFTHATAVLGPALLSLAESEKLSGLELMDAYIIGLELHARIGKIVNPEHFQKGWHSTSTVGTIGTAGACARLLGLDTNAVLNALSIGFSLASGSKRQFGSMMKPMHAGLAAQHAVMAAKMAAEGMTGNPDFLTGPWSFQELYGVSDLSRNEMALQNLGKNLCLLENGLLVKRFPCCASSHKTLDGLLDLKELHNLKAENIQHVKTKLPELLSRNLPFNRPQNEMEARFSLQYSAARILLDGTLSLQHFTKEAIKEPQVTEFLERIHVETIPNPEKVSTETPLYSRIELKNGEAFEISAIHLKGSISNPLSPADVENKFIDCLRFVGKEEKAEKFFNTAMSIAKLEQVTVLTEQIYNIF
jgi:2-methylcitrate dehydratase PrpD